MKYKFSFISIFFSFYLFADDYVFLSSSPDNFSEIIGSTIKKEIYTSENFLEFSLDEQKSCISEGICFQEIKEKSENSVVIYLSTFANEEERYIFYTFIDLESKTVIKDLGATCKSCSRLDLIQLTKDLLNDKTLSSNEFSSYTLFPAERFSYPKNITEETNLIDYEISTSVPAEIFIDNKFLGFSPQKIKAKKNTKAQIKIVAPYFEVLTKEFSFQRNKKEKFNLSPMLTNLVVSTYPSRATLFINGKKIGSTPRTVNKLKVGTEVDIKISLENYIDNTFTYNPLDPESNQINVDLERGKGLLKVKHDVNDSERDQIYVTVNGRFIGTLDKFNNDILILDAGRNDIELTKGDITRKDSFKVKIDDFLNWEVAFIESVEINISF